LVWALTINACGRLPVPALGADRAASGGPLAQKPTALMGGVSNLPLVAAPSSLLVRPLSTAELVLASSAFLFSVGLRTLASPQAYQKLIGQVMGAA